MRSWIKKLVRGAASGVEDRFRLKLVHVPQGSTIDGPYFDLAYKSNIENMLTNRKVNLVIDVGANTGHFALNLRKLGYQGRIVSFEPASQALEVLTKLASDDPSWIIRRTALGRTTSELLMNISHMSNFNSLLKPKANYSSLFESSDDHKVTQESVPVDRLDNLWAEIIEGIKEPRCFLKIDTQGFDSEVIGGSTEVVLPACVAIQFEGSVEPIYEGQTPWSTLIDEVRQFGFKLSGLFPCAYGENDEVIEMDCLMIRV